jgi:hypothetical protein
MTPGTDKVAWYAFCAKSKSQTTGKTLAADVTPISPLSVVLFGTSMEVLVSMTLFRSVGFGVPNLPFIVSSRQHAAKVIRLEKGGSFRCYAKTAVLLKYLRQSWVSTLVLSHIVPSAVSHHSL